MVSAVQVNKPWLSTINVQVSSAADTNLPDAGVGSSTDNDDRAGAHLLTVPQRHFIHMKQAVSIETLPSDEDDDFLL